MSEENAPQGASGPLHSVPPTSQSQTSGAGNLDAVAAVQQAVSDTEAAARRLGDAASAQTGQTGPVAPDLPDLESAAAKQASPDGVGLLEDVQLEVRIELGRTRMLVEDVLKLTPESVVELDKAAGDPVDIYVNGRHVARGEVLVLNENFCVRVSEIIGKGPVPMDPA